MLAVSNEVKNAAKHKADAIVSDRLCRLSDTQTYDFLINFFAFKSVISDVINGDYISKKTFLNLYSSYASASLYANEEYPVSDKKIRFVDKEYVFLYNILKERSNFESYNDFFSWIKSNCIEESKKPIYSDYVGQASRNPVSLEERVFRGFDVSLILPSAKPKNITLDSFGGNKAAKEEIYFLAKAIENPQAYRQAGSRLPRGLVFYGPPGTGKTLLARIFASIINKDFYEVRLESILDKYVGETEKKLSRILDSDGVIFIDEFDNFARNNPRLSEASENIVNILAIKLDGFQEKNSNIYIAATNDIKNIHPKLLRPGRFDKIIYFDYLRPDEIAEVLSIHLRNAESIAERALFQNINLKIIVDNLSKIQFITGADISEIVRRTTEAKARQFLTSGKLLPYKESDFIEQIQKYTKITPRAG